MQIAQRPVDNFVSAVLLLLVLRAVSLAQGWAAIAACVSAKAAVHRPTSVIKVCLGVVTRNTCLSPFSLFVLLCSLREKKTVEQLLR